MQETLRIKEQHLNQKDLDYDELKKKLTANPKGNYKLKADFWKIASPAFAIINDTTQSFTGGVKNLKYTDLRKVLDIIIQLRDEAQRTQKLCEDVYNKNQELLNGGLSTFELKIHDAKIKQKIEMECHKKYGRT